MALPTVRGVGVVLAACWARASAEPTGSGHTIAAVAGLDRWEVPLPLGRYQSVFLRLVVANKLFMTTEPEANDYFLYSRRTRAHCRNGLRLFDSALAIREEFP